MATLIKELAPAFKNSIYGFRPFTRIYYEQNQANNTTTYTTDTYGQLLDTNGIIDSVNYNFVNNLGGNQQPYNGSASTQYVSNMQFVYLGSQIVTVNHNTAGSAPTVNFQNGGSSSVGDQGGSDTYLSEVYQHTAPTIPRVSLVSSNANTVANKKDFGVQVDFTISRYSSSFTHTLEFVSGGTTYTIGTGLATSGSYTFPTSLIPNYPSSGSPTITVTCKTYNGGSLIGTSTTTVYLNVPSSYVPTCSLAIDDDNTITKAWGIWVKSRSFLKGVITADGVSGSTISSYLSTFETASFTTNSFGKSIATSGSITVTSTVTDSRGRTATDSDDITVIDYTVPTIVSASVQRCLVDGTQNDFGTYGKVVCEYAISPCNTNNEKNLKVTFGSQVKSFILTEYYGTYMALSSELFSSIEINTTYNFVFELTDSFETTPQTVQVIPSYTLVSYRAGGKGITFGQVATEDGFNCYLDADFKNGIKVNGTIIAEIVED